MNSKTEAKFDQEHNEITYLGSDANAPDFAERVRLNQRKLRSDLKSQYDFIVCGSGSSGSVVARRLAENANVSVLLLEAGGDDDVPSIMDASQWPLNLGSERDWSFQSQPDPRLNGRSVPLSMGKVLGGGSSINVMVWARGHKSDWDFFASEAGDPAWSYASVLNIYRPDSRGHHHDPRGNMSESSLAFKRRPSAEATLDVFGVDVTLSWRTSIRAGVSPCWSMFPHRDTNRLHTRTTMKIRRRAS